MAISVDFSTKVITIPKSFMTMLSATLYELDVNAFRLALKDIEDNEGIAYLDTHRHNTQVVLAGVTYARTVEIINGYTVTFEDGQYAVKCVGANHNLADVKNLNQVSLIIGNSAGLIGVGSPSDIANAVWDEPASNHNTSGTTGNKLNSAASAGDPWSADLSTYGAGTAGKLLNDMKPVVDATAIKILLIEKILRNKSVTDPATGKITIYDDNGTSVLLEANIFEDAAGSQAYRSQGIERRERLA